ncbi:MAG: hypothetical protein H0W42_03995 [Gemmatimonadaceae bacterium]|nr:hypothetical protein [Gemmatimonadaceae bacterium]
MRIALVFFIVVSCAREEISWGPVTYFEESPEARAGSAMLPPRGGAGCAEVVVVAQGEARYAAWWEVGEGGSSVLMLAGSSDGGTHWDTPIVADQRDAGGLRCARPLPSLFADSASEYLHLTYHLSPQGSPGVYFTHSMKASALGTSGEGVLHMPVAVIHGERPVRSSVAGRGDTVVVAFEDPNSRKPRVLLALSTGAGHAFTTYDAVSPTGAAASSPRVSLDGRSVIVRWQEEITAGSYRAASRSGRLR